LLKGAENLYSGEGEKPGHPTRRDDETNGLERMQRGKDPGKSAHRRKDKATVDRRDRVKKNCETVRVIATAGPAAR
jgi:hypothetical protein